MDILFAYRRTEKMEKDGAMMIQMNIKWWMIVGLIVVLLIIIGSFYELYPVLVGERKARQFSAFHEALPNHLKQRTVIMLRL